MIDIVQQMLSRAIRASRLHYAVLVLLCIYGAFAPTAALFVLALLHWIALDAIRTLKAAPRDPGIAAQVASIEQKYRFCGDGVSITNSQIYRVGDRKYLVEVTRAQAACTETH